MPAKREIFPGSKWWKIDFHVHTPASNGYEKADTTEEEILKSAMLAKNDCIVVTDHNSGGWIDILKEKNVVGILASADGHDGCPGNAQSPYPKHQHQFHFCGSGLTAVLCDTLTREAVYDALYNRRCYGTTGAPIILEFTCGDYIMGDEICNQTTPPVFAVSCKGTNSIKEIRIVKNGSICYIHPCCNIHDITFTYTDENYDGKDANYYVRVVQTDMESAWSSPIFFIKS